jgi:propanol-preferring alcohol dehydrogenase
VAAINAIHLDHMPAFDYDKLLGGERQIRSIANMTRDDARDFLPRDFLATSFLATSFLVTA